MPYTLVSPPTSQQAAPSRYKLVKPPEAPSTISDVAKSAGSGLVRGVTGLMGLPGDLQDIVGAGVLWAGDKMGLPRPPEDAPKPPDLTPGSSAVTNFVERNLTGPLYEPKTTAGKYAETVGEFAPATLGGPGGLMRRFTTQTLLPAVASETAGQATEGTRAEPYARMAGALAGAAAPGAISRAVTPLPVSPERQAMVDVLRAEGINPTAGQTSGRRALRYFENELGGGSYERAMSRVDDQFTRAVLRRAGVNAERATPDVMDQAFANLGQRFDDLASRTSVPLDAQLQNELLNTVTDYQAVAGQVAPGVEQIMNRISNLAVANGNVLEGEAYKNIRSKIGEWVKVADAPTKQALRDIQGHLDDAVERHMPTGMVDEWRAARREYRNMLVVENAATGAGEATAMGAVTPARLRQAAVGQDKRGYVRGRSEYSDLAHAGQSILTPMPQSGTAPRIAARGAAALPALIGGGIGGQFGGIEAMTGMVGGALVPYLMGRGSLSRPVQSYLANQAAAGAARNMGPSVRRAALLQALMAPRLTSQ